MAYLKPWGDDCVFITSVHTAASYRHRQVATALLMRMHLDHLDYFVDVGQLNKGGEGLYQHIQRTQPEFSTVVLQAGARELGEGLEKV